MITIGETLQFMNILYSFIGVFVGITFGAIPGLTATMGVILFLPFTFGMGPVASFALLLGIYVGGIYGGSITAILIKTPGTPSSAATVLDGYPLAEQGKASEALSMATIASFVGGIISCVSLIVLSPQLANFSLRFGPAEYFAVGLFGLSIVASLSADNILKGLLAAFLGLLIATVGMDPVLGNMRFTFGRVEMLSGVDAVSALIGMFAISEVFDKAENIFKQKAIGNIKIKKNKIVGIPVLKDNFINLMRSSFIGTLIGIIPATGSGVASWLSYNEAKRASKKPELFGKGSFEGVAASEAANNAVTGGALIPLLTLGIPGDVVTAVILGALMIQGLTPGPMLFQNNREVVIGIYMMLILANIFMLILGLLGTKLFVKVLKVPINILMPVVGVLCLVGAYAINNRVFDLKIALFMGIIGYLFNKANIPIPPMLLGIILSPIIESNFRLALAISHNDWSVFFTKPICLIFIIFSVLSFMWPIFRKMFKKKFSSDSL